MYVRVLIGRDAGEVKFFRNDIARAMLLDGRAERPIAEIEVMVTEPVETAVKKKRRRGRRR